MWIEVLKRLMGEIIHEFASQCDHLICNIRGYPTNKESMLESCRQCKIIRLYDINTGTCKTVCTGFQIIRMYAGLSGSVLALDKSFRLLQFDWNQDDKSLYLVHEKNVQENFVEANIDRSLQPVRICYVDQNDIVVFTTRKFRSDPFDVRAIKPKDIWDGRNGVHWKLSVIVKPNGLTCDTAGNIYFSDIENRNILVIDLPVNL